MKKKCLPYWIKGGIIGGIISGIFLSILPGKYISYLLDILPFFGSSFERFFWGFLITAPIALMIFTYNSVIGFLFGAVIGLIIGKIKRGHK